MRRMYGSSGRAPQRFLPIARRDAGRRQRDKDRSLHLLKPAFIGHDAFPCGYSTSGQICSVVGLIAEGKANSTDEIRKLVSGNICRRVGECTNRTPAIGTAMGSRVHEISDRKIAARFSGRLPTTRCGEDDRRLLRFSNGFLIFSNRSVTHADRDGDPKLARLRC